MKVLSLSALALTLTLTAHAAQARPNIPDDTIPSYRINEVVITSSTKETNNLRTLPGSLSLFSTQTVRAAQIDALKDLSSLVPNLYIPDYGARLTSAIYLRGVGARSSGQSVGLYVDNVPFPDKSAYDFELADIQRIEVLRGPQGTLYGRNAMAGIVNIYTLSPFDATGTRIALSAGNYGQLKARASHYARLGNAFGLSAGAWYGRHDGFFTNQQTGDKADAESSAGGRLKLEWRPDAPLSAAYTLSYDHVDQGAFPYGLYHNETGQIDPVRIGDPSSYRRDVLTHSLALQYRAPRFVLASVTGYQYLDDNMQMDQDFSPKTLFTLQQQQKQNALNEELTIRSLGNANYQWSFGLYGFLNDFHTESPVLFRPDGVKDILQKVFDDLRTENPRMPALQIMDDELSIPGSFDTPSRGGALFHQSTYNNILLPGLSLTAGLRLDYEKQRLVYRSSAMMRLGIVRGGQLVEIPGIQPSVIDVATSQSFSQLLPKLSLRYACSPQTFAYLSAAKGYKAGGYNIQMSADLMQSQMQYDLMTQFAPAMAVEPETVETAIAYRPEYSWNYELGLRSELPSQQLAGELTFFLTDINDIQITRFVDSGSGRILANAGHARSFGAELTLRARLCAQLTADLNYGYTHAGDIPYIPAHTLNAGLQYIRLYRHAWVDQFSASAQLNATGPIRWTEQNGATQPFYALLNAKAGVRKGIVRFDLWARNLTNTSYSAFYFESLGQPYVQKGKPLRVGIEVSLAF
ncbi:MAG: TonB-dependent receptor [Tannerellaceae bacterium]|jgi:outer membrane receptor protein involved in Fe transport|nr:TonB-dependent receptor [Tannerellaceae bacterium]